MSELTEKLQRTIVICAERSTVFRFFTDSNRFASWWGAGSTIEGKPGGKVLICHPGNVISSGEILEIVDNERVVFTYGFESGSPMPPGGSKVTITLHDHSDGTELKLLHEFSDAAARDHHIQGWRYQLALFANVACKDQHSGYVNLLDEYFNIWNNPDIKARKEKMQGVTSENVSFRDAYGCVSGIDELNAHIEATHKFMPGLTLERVGEPYECQGTALTRWKAKRPDGSEAARGTNLFHFTPDGHIKDITGFWMQADR